jgi:chaperonin GroEL
MAKKIIFNDEAQQKLVAGVNKLADAVVATFGPRGSNVAIDKSWGAPTVLHDGVSVAKEIVLEDPFENMGAQLVKEAASKTNDAAGDGTTTATVLAQQLVVMGMKNITAGANPIMLRRGMNSAVELIIKEIEKIAKPVKEDEWVKVATISAQDATIGEQIAKALKLVGANGLVEVEEGRTMEIEIEHKEGMSFDKGFASPYFVTNPDQMMAMVESPYILITDQKLSSMQDLLPVLENVMKLSKNFVIIADDFEGEVLATLAVNKMRGVFNVLAVKAPGFGDRRKAMLEDIAVLTGGKVVTAELGGKLTDVTIDDLGRADSVRSTKDNTSVVGGKGQKAKLNLRIAELKKQVELTKSEFDREKLEERIAKLSAGVAVIKVGAATEVELKELQERVKDAKEATKAAIQEGVIPGGGVAYLQALKVLETLAPTDADEMAGVRLVREALQMPVRVLADNSGADGGWVVKTILAKNKPGFGFNAQTLEFGDMLSQGVIDPAKVAKHALMNAASVAGGILTTRVLITEIKEDKSPAHSHGGGMGDMM